VEHAIVGRFFVREGGGPLGELRTGGVRRRSVPFLPPWSRLRACVHVDGGGSTSLVCGGRLANHPREQEGAPIPGGRPVATAVIFEERAGG
jgi:hypothetical protein